ncbi:MAG: hypothetical protein K2X69_14970 [Silvanigrellaceae bacterium]|nr:hypothetical protein [Silvanigrellaceae bacterium]
MKIENVHLFKNKDNYCLFVGKNHQLGYLKDTKNSHNYSKWDDREFLIVSDSFDKLKLLQEEMLKNNVGVFIGGCSDNPFNSGGLIIVILDKIKQKYKDRMFAQDEDSERLVNASKAIGIIEEIDSINDNYVKNGGNLWDVPCGYFALQPKWIKEDLKHKSVYNVMYWLNPYKQDKHNFGWYTVEELKEWTKGKGPVIKR